MKKAKALALAKKEIVRLTLDSMSRVRKCANPDCPEYFYAADGKQRLCGSKECAVQVGRRSRRDWWRKHGKAWRDARK